MNHKPRYITKSRFKLGLECPTKLYYTNKHEYKNTKLEDSFLEALAEGGFQVGELAKFYHPGGHEIETLDYEEAERQTRELLKQDNVIIYEPAIRYGDLFIRIDILVKQGNFLELIEVKSKSYDASEDKFIGQRGGIDSEWKPYLYDVAFQNYVLSKAYPNSTVIPYLMLVDKNSTPTIDSLNQYFKVVKDRNGRTKAVVTSNENLCTKILTKINVQEPLKVVYSTKITHGIQEFTFDEYVKYLSTIYKEDSKAIVCPTKECKKCEFKCTPDEEKDGLKNGFKECWEGKFNWNDEDFEKQNVLNIWDNRSLDKFLNSGKIKMKDFVISDFEPKSKSKNFTPGLERYQRQWLQVEKAQNNDISPHLDIRGIKAEMSKWKFPFHFIDFETTRVAIPFNKGKKPYEQIAFQFSHHKVYEDGTIEHANQFINTEIGRFPNFQFIRALKKALEQDQGTIFRYSNHENTVLNDIYWQIQKHGSELEDSKELCDFIQSITKSTGSSSALWEGSRCMVDLLDLTKKYYYDPYTQGSNSLKYVLPAILNSSKYLQEKYSQPIYGSTNGIKSSNFKDHTWITVDNDIVKDPYEMLPKLFSEYEYDQLEELDFLTTDTELRNGGAAMMAYARMQFTEMNDIERQELTQALLKYCELDTLAMVMLYEGWREMIK